jgi:RHS repeat-associated protein
LDGRVDFFDLGGGQTRDVSYDDAGRIRGYFDIGRLRDEAFTFIYDDAGALTEFRSTAPGKAGGFTLELDANGNRKSLTSDRGTDVYTVDPDSNRLSSISIAGAQPRTYRYDNAGNVLSDGINGFEYDGRGRLISATNAQGTTEYRINGLGQRVAKLGAGTGSYFVYDEAGRLVGEYNLRGGLVQEIVYLDDMPVAVLRHDGRFFVFPDHLGTPRAIADTSGKVVWRWDGDPFGATPPSEDSTFTYNLRFPGQYFDEETGLFHNYFRDYDPQTGRYIQADPIGLEGGINPYLYAEGNPLTFIDPYGLGALNGSPYSDEGTGGVQRGETRQALDDPIARWQASQASVQGFIRRTNESNLRMGTFAASIGVPLAAAGTAAAISAAPGLLGPLVLRAPQLVGLSASGVGGMVISGGTRSPQLTVAVGRLSDTAAAVARFGYERLYEKGYWSPQVNMMYIRSAMQLGARFHLSSPLTAEYLTRTEQGRTIMSWYARELLQSGAWGYIKMGEYLVPGVR